MSKENKTLIQLSANQNYCLSTKSIFAGSKIILYHQTGAGGGERQQWILDQENNVIRLACSPNLVITFSQKNQELYLDEYAPGRINQQWDWSNTSGSIASYSYPDYVIDNSNSREQDNNPILLWSKNGSAAQKWTLFVLSETTAKLPALMV